MSSTPSGLQAVAAAIVAAAAAASSSAMVPFGERLLKAGGGEGECWFVVCEGRAVGGAVGGNARCNGGGCGVARARWVAGA